MRRLGGCVALAGVMAIIPAETFASSITFSFTGVVEQEVTGGQMTDVPLGTAVSGFYTFESSTTGMGNALTANYFALTDASLTVGSSTYTSVAVEDGVITTINNLSGIVDQYLTSWQFSGESALPSGNTPFEFQLYVEDFGNPPDLLTSTALPLTPPDFALATVFVPYFSFVTEGPDGKLDYRGELTSLTLQPTASVPDQASTLTLFSGLALAAAAVRGLRQLRIPRRT